MSTSLASRGQSLLDKPLRADFAYFAEVQQNPFEPASNPTGGIAMCIAENVLNWPLVESKLRELAQEPIPAWVGQYTATVGAPEFREALAGFAERRITTIGNQHARKLDPQRFCVASGATGVIELAAYLLGDPGDVVAFPAPRYPVYEKDVGLKAGLISHDIQPATGWHRNEGMHPLSLADLDRTLHSLQANGKRLAMLVLTQPDNPTGSIFTRLQLESFAAWAIQHEVHLCVNELYALSTLKPEHDALSQDYPAIVEEFYSFLHLIEAHRSPYLHWWYSMSKDFGLSGLRCGMMYTRNEALVQAFGNLAAPHTVSNHTQWLLAGLLNDDVWLAAFAKTQQDSLTEAYTTVVRTLREFGVAYTPGRGSLFVWAQLAAPGEEELVWRQLYQDHGLLLTAPGGFGEQAGYLRIVYSCVSWEQLEEAMRRLKSYLQRHNSI